MIFSKLGPDEIWLIKIIVGILAAVAAVELILFLRDFYLELDYLKKERRRAYGEKEYRYWMKRIRRYYLRLIPFVPRRIYDKERLG